MEKLEQELKAAKQTAAAGASSSSPAAAGESAGAQKQAVAATTGSLGIPVEDLETYLKYCVAIIVVLFAVVLPIVRKFKRFYGNF